MLIQKKSSTFAPDLQFTQCPDGGIGRRAGLKHQWIHFHAGSTPAPGTKRQCRYFMQAVALRKALTHLLLCKR